MTKVAHKRVILLYLFEIVETSVQINKRGKENSNRTYR